MSTKISGLIPLLLRKSTILPAMRTFVEISLFYGGLISPHYMVISPEEIALLSVAFGGIVALLISRFRWNDHDVALWKLSKRSFLSPVQYFSFWVGGCGVGGICLRFFLKPD